MTATSATIRRNVAEAGPGPCGTPLALSVGMNLTDKLEAIACSFDTQGVPCDAATVRQAIVRLAALEKLAETMREATDGFNAALRDADTTLSGAGRCVRITKLPKYDGEYCRVLAIRAIRGVTGWHLKEARDAIVAACEPLGVLQCSNPEQADAVAKALVAVGAAAFVVAGPT